MSPGKKKERGKSGKKPDVDAGLLAEENQSLLDGDLIAGKEALPPSDTDSFEVELEKSLSETQEEAQRYIRESDAEGARTWADARKLVERFEPVPWFIWRLASHIFGQPGAARPITEGHVKGLRRLLLAIASDPFFATGNKVTNVYRALEIVRPDVMGAVSVIHAVCRRLASCQFERIWRPIIDDAILRSQIGYFVGERNELFGPGRGMLAGFSGRCGLAILIASGELEQARRALEMLATGADISRVGVALYGCDPLQVSAMTLSACGCGRDAAFGTVSYASSRPLELVENEFQLSWLSAFSIVELVRMGREREVNERLWEALGFHIGQDRGDLVQVARSMIRTGHSLNWIL